MLDKKDVVLVAGAGLSGVFAALELSKKHKVILIESAKQIIPETSSSYNECYKLHLGMHYAGDLPTAEGALGAAIQFIRYIGSDCLAGGNDLNAPSRRGRFMFMSNSQFAPEEVEGVVSALQAKYRKLVQEDKANEVLGNPDHLIKPLESKDYNLFSNEIPYCNKNGQMELAKIVCGYETAESQIDIAKLRHFLEGKIRSNKNIEVYLETSLQSIAHSQDRLDYCAILKSTGAPPFTLRCDAVCNSTWSQAEYIDKRGGFYVPEENRVIRVKVLIKIKLPAQLHKMNTTIFSVGPYASFTNLGDGKAVIASEITTNVGFYKAGGYHPLDLHDVAPGKLNLNSGVGKALSEKIRAEAATYFNSLEIIEAVKTAPILEIMVGHVKMMSMEKEYKQDSLHEKESPIHQRQHTGVEVRDLCYVSNSGNKMTYTYQNALKVATIFDNHFLKRNQLRSILREVETKLEYALITKGLWQKYKPIYKQLVYVTCKKALIRPTQDEMNTHGFPETDTILSDLIRMLECKHRLSLDSTKLGLYRVPNEMQSESTTIPRELKGSIF